VPKDLGSNATLTPVPKTPFELIPTHVLGLAQREFLEQELVLHLIQGL